MINKQLKVGDYIFTAKGALARIISVNKSSYSFRLIAGNCWYERISCKGFYRDSYDEWFECDDAQSKAFEIAIAEYKVANKTADILCEVKEIIGKAKHFLKDIEDIPEVDVYEE